MPVLFWCLLLFLTKRIEPTSQVRVLSDVQDETRLVRLQYTD